MTEGSALYKSHQSLLFIIKCMLQLLKLSSIFPLPRNKTNEQRNQPTNQPAKYHAINQSTSSNLPTNQPLKKEDETRQTTGTQHDVRYKHSQRPTYHCAPLYSYPSASIYLPSQGSSALYFRLFRIFQIVPATQIAKRVRL